MVTPFIFGDDGVDDDGDGVIGQLHTNATWRGMGVNGLARFCVGACDD